MGQPTQATVGAGGAPHANLATVWNDDAGRMAAITDPLGRVTTYADRASNR